MGFDDKVFKDTHFKLLQKFNFYITSAHFCTFDVTEVKNADGTIEQA